MMLCHSTLSCCSHVDTCGDGYAVSAWVCALTASASVVLIVADSLWRGYDITDSQRRLCCTAAWQAYLFADILRARLTASAALVRHRARNLAFLAVGIVAEAHGVADRCCSQLADDGMDAVRDEHFPSTACIMRQTNLISGIRRSTTGIGCKKVQYIRSVLTITI